jgi:type VI secretion system protein ImpG
MAIAEIQPDSSRGDLSKGFIVPRGTMMDSLALKNRRDLQLYHGARGQPAAAENRQGRAGRRARRSAAGAAGPEPTGINSALRIRIACDGPQNLGHLDFDRLFFLGGPDIEALKLLELVMEHHAGIVCQTVSPQPQRQLLASDALRQEGFESDQALLPDDLRNFDGYRLLQEYFAFPARFRFISLSGLSRLIQRCEDEKAFDIFILLDKSDEQLERR